jgi:hypothetical protein
VVEDIDGEVAGKVTWIPIPHGPNPESQALNVGIRPSTAGCAATPEAPSRRLAPAGRTRRQRADTMTA